jgi:hypothetical protein
MKKLLILSVLLGLMALPMFASDITFGGDLKYGFIGDFGDTFNEATDITFDIKAAIDDYSSLTINVDGLETQVDGLGLNGVDGVDISKALVATDIGMWLDLPVGVVASWVSMTRTRMNSRLFPTTKTRIPGMLLLMNTGDTPSW